MHFALDKSEKLVDLAGRSGMPGLVGRPFSTILEAKERADHEISCRAGGDLRIVVADRAREDAGLQDDPRARHEAHLLRQDHPPTATYPVPLPKPLQPITTTRPDGAGYVDPQHDEDTLVRAQMRNICRGC